MSHSRVNFDHNCTSHDSVNYAVSASRWRRRQLTYHNSDEARRLQLIDFYRWRFALNCHTMQRVSANTTLRCAQLLTHSLRRALCLHEVEQGGDMTVIGRRQLVINRRRRRAGNQRGTSRRQAGGAAFISPVLNQSSIPLAGRQSARPSTVSPLSRRRVSLQFIAMS